jgi:ABC-2 type transport system ATP-binding protein
VPSDAYYYEDMTVSRLLNYSASFYNKNLKSRITHLADILTLDMNKKFEDLSYGNKKKVAIAQALLHSPELLILDEPTSGLDPLMKKNLFELLLEENKKGVTIFFSSHVLSEVQQLSHRIGMMKDGKIIKEATFDEIRSNVWTKFKVETAEALSIPLQGVKDFRKDNNVYSFIYSGNIDILIKELSRHTITLLEATEPPLEEIFMHYYEG